MPLYDKPLDSYYVTLRSAANDSRRVIRFSAHSFCGAELQAIPYIERDEQIVDIVMDYKI